MLKLKLNENGWKILTEFERSINFQIEINREDLVGWIFTCKQEKKSKIVPLPWPALTLMENLTQVRGGSGGRSRKSMSMILSCLRLKMRIFEKQGGKKGRGAVSQVSQLLKLTVPAAAAATGEPASAARQVSAPVSRRRRRQLETTLLLELTSGSLVCARSLAHCMCAGQVRQAAPDCRQRLKWPASSLSEGWLLRSLAARRADSTRRREDPALRVGEKS